MKRNIDLENLIVNEYLSGINNNELCKKYNKSRSYIQKVLIRYNVKLRKGSEVTKKYNINEDFFHKIDNKNKAYILGLLFSDGTISGTVAKINLIETDKHILYDIAKCIYYDNNYQINNIKSIEKKWSDGKKYVSKPQTLLTLTRKKIVDDLKKYGLCEKKSFKIRFPNINKDYYSDFIRGYFDGDGCFYSSKKYRNNNRVQIISNKNFINDLKKVLKNTINIDSIIKETKTRNIIRLNIYGNNKVKKFLDWIYNDSGLKLERKFKHYKNSYY